MATEGVSRLEAKRIELGLSRKKVATDVGLSERQLHRLERGVTPLRRPWVLLFESYYEVERGYFDQDELVA